MKARTPALTAVIFLTVATSAIAHPDFDELRAAMDGEIELLEKLKSDFRSEKPFHLVAGAAMERSDRDDEAVAHYRKAAQAGSRIAVRALAQHFTERKDYVSGYAWSYLAMQLVPDAAEMSLEDWAPHWEFQTAGDNARKLDDEQTTEAEQLAQQLVAELLPGLEHESTDDEDHKICMESIAEKRTAPRYPKELANARQPGWAHVYLLVGSDGSVSDVVPIVESDHRFARETRNSIRRWRFEKSVDSDCDSQFYSQTMDFTVDR